MKKYISRKNQFTYWLAHKAEHCGIMQPPLKDALALQFIKDYLLGEDWYVVNPVNPLFESDAPINGIVPSS